MSAPPVFDVLVPSGRTTATADELCAELTPWARAPADRPLVLCNMVASLDGRIAVDGGSTGLGGEGDHSMFHGLRTVVDAVLAGTGTLRAERYGRLVRREERRAARVALGLEADPLAFVLTRTGDVPWDAPMFEAPEQCVVVACPHRIEVPEGVSLIRASGAREALEVLRRDFGVRSVLCEGGPTLNRGLIAEGVLDELFLTVDAQLVGGDIALRVLAGQPLPEPLRAELLWVLRHRDELLLRYSL